MSEWGQLLMLSPYFFPLPMPVYMYTYMPIYTIACSEEGFLKTQLKAWKTQTKTRIFSLEI